MADPFLSNYTTVYPGDTPTGDTAGAVDGVSVAVTLSGTASDSAPAADSYSTGHTQAVAVSESVPTSDVLRAVKVRTASTVDYATSVTYTYPATFGPAYVTPIPLSETTTGSLSTSHTVTDSAPATDSLYAVSPVAPRTATDTAGAADTVAVSSVHQAQQSASAGDSVPLGPDVSAGVLAPIPRPRPGRGSHVRLYDLTGTRILAVLPDFQTLTCQDEFNAPGQMTMDYPLSGVGASILKGVEVGLLGVYDGGRQVFLSVLDEDSDDPADDSAGDRLLAISAPGSMQLLDWARVYPEGGFDTPAYQDFVHVSPGQVMVTLLADAQARGTLNGVNGPKVTLSFDANVDSAGLPWPSTVWVRYTAGQSMLDVLNDLIAKGYVDARMRGLTLDCYAADSYLARDLPGVFLHRTREVMQTPRTRRRKDLYTALLLTGSNLLSTEVADPTAVAAYGRREGYLGQGDVQNYQMLTEIGNATLAQQSRPQEQHTADYVREEGGPQPWTDYRPGDYVRCDWVRNPDGTYQALRVRSIAASFDQNGLSKASLELNDLLLEEDVRLARQVNVLLRQSLGLTTTPDMPISTDTVAPDAPGAVYVASQTSVDQGGNQVADATVSWPQVMFNTDGTAFDDLGAYLVSYRYTFRDGSWSGWSGDASTRDLSAHFAGLPYGASFQARVAASDYNSNRSPYTLSAIVTLSLDTVAPPEPSAPTVVPLIAALRVVWDGLAVDELTPMPSDFSHVEVHASTVPGFTPTSATLRDTVYGVPGETPTTLTDLSYDTAYYVRLVAVDTSGNHSPPSPQTGPATVNQVGAGDLSPSAITDTDHSGLWPADTGFQGGALTADTAAFDGAAILLAAGQTAAGIGYAGLKPGRYRATWLLRMSGNQPSGQAVATLHVTDTTAGSVDDGGGRTVVSDDLPGLRYSTVSVLFTVTATTTGLDLPVAALQPVYLSAAYVQPVQSIALAEIGDAEIGSLNVSKLLGGTLAADVIIGERIRVGGGLAGTAFPRLEMGTAGLLGFAADGHQTIKWDPGDGSVSVTGSIEAGSDLPGSVYAANLIQNAGFEDPLPGDPNGWPAGWTDAYQIGGTGSVARAETASPLGGTRSLSIDNPNTGSGRGVASKEFVVTPRERLQVQTQVRVTGVTGPVYVRVVFGTQPGFTMGQLVAAAPTVQNAQVLGLDGSYVAAGKTGGGAGYGDIASGWTPPVLGTVYRLTGSILVPAGASYARVVLYGWTRGGTTAGTSTTTFDATGVLRSADGATLLAATITGPVIQTATTGNRIEMLGTTDTASIRLYANKASTYLDPTGYAYLTEYDRLSNGLPYASLKCASETAQGLYTGWSADFESYECATYTATGTATYGVLAVDSGGVSMESNNGGMSAAIGGKGGRIEVDYVGFGQEVMVYNGLDITSGGLSTSGSKQFSIPHPLDPERLSLVHASLEGPENGVHYRGEAEVPAGGHVDVDLPHYFEALVGGHQRTVYLTPVAEPGPGGVRAPRVAAGRVVDGRFRVYELDGVPGRFTWQVLAARSDIEPLDVEPEDRVAYRARLAGHAARRARRAASRTPPPHTWPRDGEGRIRPPTVTLPE